MIGGQWWDNPDYALDMTYGGELLLVRGWITCSLAHVNRAHAFAHAPPPHPWPYLCPHP